MKLSKIKFWVLYHVAIIIFSIGAGMLMKYNQTGNALHPTTVVPVTVIILTSAGVGYLVTYTVNKAKSIKPPQLNKWIVPALLIFYVSAFLIANVSVTSAVFGWYLYTGTSLDGFWTQMFQHELNYANISFFSWLLFFTIAFFYVLWQKSAKKEQKLMEENLKYRYNTLKSQVNPHFLFNSLNTLSEIVYEDAKKADNYIQKLSAIYRYILENEETELVPLKKELEFVKQYFNLQQERDNGKIALEVDLPYADRFKIVPVSLQILVENVLKHNSMSLESPLKIHIYFSEGHVVVANNIQKKNIFENSTQTGLANLMERVKLVMEKEIVVSADNNHFLVKLPVIGL